MYIGYPPTICTWRSPPDTFESAPKTGVWPKMGQKGRFLGPISVFDQNSKEFLKNLKYFLGSGPISEKKWAKKKWAKKGSKQGFLAFGPILPILPHFPCFTLFRPHLGVRRLIWGLRADEGRAAMGRWLIWDGRVLGTGYI